MSKQKMRLLTMLAMTSALASGDNRFLENIASESRSKKSSKEEIAKANGLKEFNIGGKSYWAINYKNAIRKFNKDKTKTK